MSDAHQQPEVGLLAHEGLVHQPLVDDHAAHRQRESGVRADPDRHEVAAVDRRGAVVGCDGDDVAAVVAGLGEEVVPRDGAVGRVVGPDQQQLGVKPVVVAVRRVEASEGDVEARVEVVDLGLDVGGGDAETVEDGAGQDHRLRAALARRADAHDRLGARLLDGVQHGVGDLGQRLVPGDALELALAALARAPQRMEHALLPVEHLAPGAPFWQPVGFMSGTPSSTVWRWPEGSSRTTRPSRT